PLDRTAYVLETAAPLLTLTTATDGDALPASAVAVDVETIDLDAHDVSSVHPIAPHPDNTAYVIFTSGSTGRPKGVTITHRSVVNQIAWMAERYGLGPGDTALHKTPITFDASVWELFYPLQVGARLVIAEPGGHRDPEYLVQIARRWDVCIMEFVPSMLALFVADEGLELPSSLRYLSAGGEALSPDLVARVASRSDAVLDNTYGPTEVTVTSTAFRCVGTESVSVPIGAPLRGVRAYVLDGRLNPVPVGVQGELYLSGVQVARGYIGRADLTAERFVADPFTTGGGRLYRTGDRVRWNADGMLEYLGRTDFQVKVRGLRIELGEIETALAGLPEIGQATVVVHESELGPQLVAYVVPAAGTTVELDSVRDALGASLPRYMVPAQFVVLDALPLNASGKLDRRALPEPELAAREFRAPVTDSERAVASVFEDVLGVERVGLDDDFFGLGGNSLMATRVVARLGEALDSRVPVRMLFEASTVEALAIAVSDQRGSRRIAPLVPQARPERIPLSLAQQRMWFLNRFDPESAVNNIPVVIRLSGVLDVEALRAAVADLVERHEILRTVYPEVDGAGRQIVLGIEDDGVALQMARVSEAEVFDQVVASVSTGFDVTVAPPLRIELLQVSETEHVLVVVVHHIAADGFSMGPLSRDVMVAYAARAAGEMPSWQPLDVQYADYTLWQRQLLGSETDPESLISRQLSYWTEQLADLPDVLALPTDRPRPAVTSNRGATHEFVLDPAFLAGIDALTAEHGVTRFMVVHAALAVLLARLSGTEDIAIGTPVAGRGERALDDLIGMFVNTLVLRTQIDSSESFGDLLGRVREVDLGAFGHAEVPFERLVEVLDPVRSTAWNPLFQVMLTMQNMGPTQFELPGLSLSAIDADVSLAKFDLQVTVSEQFDDRGEAAGMAVAMTYATDLFDEATVVGFAKRFERVLSGAVEDPSKPLGDIPFVTEDESTELVSAWAVPGVEIDTSSTLPALFTRVVRNWPSNTATVAGDAVLDYAELSARSNKLARRLIASGVGPGSLVAVALPRDESLVVAILAVVTAGAAYLPVDVTSPKDRLAYILTDGDPTVVLTSSDEAEQLPRVEGVEILHVDRLILDEFSSAPVTNADRLAPLRSSNLAYVIYTSGSTGRPKGVAVTHRNVVELISNAQTKFGFDESDVWTMFHSYAFDFSVWELWGPLLFGGTLVVVDYMTSRSPDEFRALVARYGVTVLNQTPSAFYQFDEADRAATSADDLRLRYVIFGGEALDLGKLTGWYDRHADDVPQLVNMYGITETTVHVSFLALTEEMSRQARSSVIGRPLPGLRTYVLDERLHPVPVGVQGEIYVAGEQLSQGYLGQASLSASRFVADPFGEGRMYRTGDLAKWNSSGLLEYAGRSDFQVQLRGFRIELGEVEAALTSCDGVAHAVAVVRAGTWGDERLVAYVVPQAGATIDPMAIRDTVGSFLTAYMVPDIVMVLDELPLTSNGKLDRRALPEPAVVAREFRAPVTDVEQIVASVLAEVLGVEQVGLDDDFFGLGGNSLVATKLVSRLNAELPTRVPLQWLFREPGVEGLAALIDRESAGDVEESVAPVLRIRTQGAGTPLFFVHPIVGLSWCYTVLARQLDHDAPVYGLQTPAVTEDDFEPATLDELAARYVDELRAVQPEGPYRLFGWSLGGVIAHAMAVRLQAEGQQVDTLVMLDSFAGNGARTGESSDVSMSELLAGFGIDDAAAAGAEDIDDLVASVASLTGNTEDDTRRVVTRLVAAAQRNSELMAEHRPGTYDGDIVYFTAAADDPTGTRGASGWNAAVTGAVDNHQVPATHWQMTSPDALDVIVPVLDAVLSERES
ncbi:MAG: amino acid adenylation domain-containing protein, partial [Rhodococcus sp. (in: high G+C Gram-positive bacteria)]